MWPVLMQCGEYSSKVASHYRRRCWIYLDVPEMAGMVWVVWWALIIFVEFKIATSDIAFYLYLQITPTAFDKMLDIYSRRKLSNNVVKN